MCDTRPEHQEVEILNRAKADCQYTMIDHPPIVLPQRPNLKPRGNPLNKTTLLQSMDGKGCIIDEKYIKNIIFHGVSLMNYVLYTRLGIFFFLINSYLKGCENSIRHEVWKYLLGYYPWNSTREQRILIGKQQKTAYERMKVQWTNKTSSQISRFNKYEHNKRLVGKCYTDVH